MFEQRSFEQPDHSVGVPDRGDFGRGYDHRCIRPCDGILETLFYSRRAVDEYVVEFCGERGTKLFHLFRVYGSFLPGLGRWNDKQIRKLSISDHRLFFSAFTFDNINQVVDDPVFQPHHNIKIA